MSAAPPEAPAAQGPEWVRGRRALAEACARWAELTAIGLDTEFERTDTYRARPALIQIHDGTATWLVDPLEIDDWSPLAELIASETTAKVLHACAEDCELLYQLTGARPAALYDTQIAAAFAGLGMQLGYEALVEKIFGTRPAGGQARSDWRARPLAPEQLRYAVEDVCWLLPARDRLTAIVAGQPRASWVEAECARIVAERAAPPDPGRAYLRVAAAARLDAPSRAALVELAAWREREAIRRDRPRRRVLADETLVALAAARPADREALVAAARGRSARWPRERIEALLAAIAAAEGSEPPPPATSASALRAVAATIRRLKRAAAARAEQIPVPQALLAPRRMIEAIALAAADEGPAAVARILDGWRDEAVGDALRDALEERS